jgi:hypothetical protein
LLAFRDVLQAKGIEKIGVFIVNDNIQGQQFWGAQGWNPRTDVTYWDYRFIEDSDELHYNSSFSNAGWDA